ncbi:MAG: hypothetical protein GF405_00905 [Candidatus Eisenbacteria bacterium]|nr:hypothetical protein [Candidatus Eisenbacteria bacterium]
MSRRLNHNTRRRASRNRQRRRKLDLGTDVETSYFFMLNCLLHSRVNTGIESNSEFYDEDVNVYLAHLLNSHIDPKHIERVSEHVATDEAHLHQLLEEAHDDRDRYTIYRATADYLLMGTSVFDIFEDRHHAHHPALVISKAFYVRRASVYYGLASSYATKLNRGRCAIAATLAKLSEGIESYVRILSYMRGEYLDFIRRYSPGELFHLERSIEQIERDLEIEKMRDEFLDTYNEWRRTGVPELRDKLMEKAERLRRYDPSFEFNPPS